MNLSPTYTTSNGRQVYNLDFDMSAVVAPIAIPRSMRENLLQDCNTTISYKTQVMTVSLLVEFTPLDKLATNSTGFKL